MGTFKRRPMFFDFNRCYTLARQLQEYARRPQETLTLKQMVETATRPTDQSRLKNAQFLYKELPIRLAKRAKELDSLPYGLSNTEPVQKVKSWYGKSFQSILSLREPQTVEDTKEFCQVLEKMLARHANVVPTMAQGVLMIKNELSEGGDLVTCPYLQDFLDRFYMSRIGLRMLISQHIAMHSPREGYAGTIAFSLSPIDIVQTAVADAAVICEKAYGIAPHVDVFGDPKLRITFVPSHLHHMLYEILKNAMRAVVELNPGNPDMPPVEVIVANGDQDWTIKIVDQGGGIKRKHMNLIWSYLHTTAQRPAELEGAVLTRVTAPMAGLGYGLPLSRLFARYFGGDLQVVSMEGYGTDVYLYLNKLQDVDLFLD